MNHRMPYRVACLQLQLLGAVSTPEDGVAYRAAAIARLDSVIAATRRHRRQAPLRLVLVPEFWLCGGPSTETPAEYAAAASVQVPGPLTDELGRLAAAHGCYIAANVIEREGDRLYDSAVLIGDDGSLRLHYREIAAAAHGTAMAAPAMTDATEAERAMPVADTELGRIALVIGSDIKYGSITELAAVNGAEVILHLANEPEMCRDVWKLSKVVRSSENRCFVVSCNNAGYADPLTTAGQTSWGGSRVVAPTGHVLAETSSPGEAVVESTIDLALVAAVRDRAGAGGHLREEGDLDAVPLTAMVVGDDLRDPSVTARATVDLSTGAARTEIRLAAGPGAEPFEVVVVVEETDATARTRTIGIGDAVFSSHVVDPDDTTQVTLVGIDVGHGDVSPALDVARSRLGDGGATCRRMVAAGAQALLVVTDGPLTRRRADALLDWARVTAWENEVQVLVVGDRSTRSADGTRELAHVAPTGDLLEVAEVGAGEWRGLPTTPITDPLLVAERDQRRFVRRSLVNLVIESRNNRKVR